MADFFTTRAKVPNVPEGRFSTVMRPFAASHTPKGLLDRQIALGIQPSQTGLIPGKSLWSAAWDALKQDAGTIGRGLKKFEKDLRFTLSPEFYPSVMLDPRNADPITALAGLFAGGAYTGGGLLGGGTGGIRMFAGPKAATADKTALKKAKEMSKAGQSRENIWKETGWVKDKDDWKFEIDDSQVAVTKKPVTEYGATYYPEVRDVDTLLPHDKLWGAYPSASLIDVSQPSTLGGRMQGTGASYSPTHIKGADLNYFRDLLRRGEKPRKGQEVIPERITLYEEPRLSPKETKSSVLHELQHSIQDREYFAKGGSLEAAPGAKVQSAREVMNELGGIPKLKAYENTHREWAELVSMDSIHHFLSIKQPRQLFGSQPWYKYSGEIRRELGPPPKRSGQKRNDWISDAGRFIANKLILEHNMTYPTGSAYAKYRNAFKFGDEKKDFKNALRRAEYALNKFDRQEIQGIRKAQGDIKSAQQTLNRPLTTEEKYEIYKRLAGEAEARNVQTRMDFTPQQRKETPPWTTLDVPEEELIYRKRY